MMRKMLGVMVWAVCAAVVIAAAPTTNEGQAKKYSDAGKTFTVSASDPWLRHPDLEAANKAIVLGLQYGPSEEGEGRPTFFVLNMGKAAGELEEIARGMIDSARKTQKDQKDVASTEKATLDGERAVAVNYLLTKDGAPMRIRGMVTRHGGNLYVAQFVSHADEWKQNEPAGQAVFESFKWTKKK